MDDTTLFMIRRRQDEMGKQKYIDRCHAIRVTTITVMYNRREGWSK
jgi:hypothetical protein